MTNASSLSPLPLDSAGLKTKADIAKLCQVSTRTVDFWVKQQRIPFLKIGRLVRFDWNEVQNSLRTAQLRAQLTPPGGNLPIMMGEIRVVEALGETHTHKN